ncbi:MAG: hypothetical protein P9M14_03360 [Candidatus Alcyoniella australis]|nr:hypothetical protein [Candidatus Alcyoniella australis]
MRRNAGLIAVLLMLLIAVPALAWEPPQIFNTPWYQPLQYDYARFPYDREAATALLQALDPGHAVGLDARGFLETQKYRAHFIFAPSPASQPQTRVALIYQKRLDLDGGDWLLIEHNARDGSTRELVRAMTLLLRPVDLDGDGVYELHLTQGEIADGYQNYRDRVLRLDASGAFQELLSINSMDTSGLIPRHPTVDRDCRLQITDLDADGDLDVSSLCCIRHYTSRRSKDPAVLSLTQYQATQYLLENGALVKGRIDEVGRVLPPRSN